jgi:class 3 adenylate cyclase
MFADTYLPHRAGITSGKAYCGLVGSPLRHEYAVMGPSTNLSARLMGKAKQGELPNLLGCVLHLPGWEQANHLSLALFFLCPTF